MSVGIPVCIEGLNWGVNQITSLIFDIFARFLILVFIILLVSGLGISSIVLFYTDFLLCFY